MLLGTFIIIYAMIILIRDKKAGTTSQLVVPMPWSAGKGAAVRGPAWLILIAVGAVMVAAPILLAASSKSVDVTYPPDSVREVQDKENLKKEDFTKFYFLRDLSILDLRQSQKVGLTSRLSFIKGQKQDKAIRPAVLRNVMLVKKKNDVDHIIFEYSTSATLAVRCLSQPASYEYSNMQRDGKKGQTWTVDINVGAIPVGQEFEIIIEATYYDAFTSPEQWDFTTYTTKQKEQEQMGTIILFPDDKPYTTMHVFEYPGEGESGDPFSAAHGGYEDPHGLTYYWSFNNIRPGYYYRFKWTW